MVAWARYREPAGCAAQAPSPGLRIHAGGWMGNETTARQCASLCLSKKKRSFACLFWLQSSQPVHAHRCQHNPSHITGSVYVVRCRQSYGSSASPESWGLLGSWSHLDALARTISVSLKPWQRNVTVQTYPWLGPLGSNSCVCCTAKQALCP